MLKTGIITKNISNSYTVNTEDGDYNCLPRGVFRFQKVTLAVGDKVNIETDNNTITKVFPRSNYSERPAVANTNYALIMTSLKEPNLSFYLLDRLIINFESLNIKPILIFSKLDLLNNEELKEYHLLKKYYHKIGYLILNNNNLFLIKLILRNKIAFLVGQTGAGKSTLINRLDPSFNIKTHPISDALGRGVHTTRHTELYKVSNFYIIDTPGFGSIDLNIKPDDVKNYFKEFKNYHCSFNDCNHLKEPCEIIKNVLNKKILPSRYDSYLKIYKECYENSRKLYQK